MTLVAIAFADLAEFGHDLAAGLARGQLHLHPSHCIAALGPVVSQGLQPADAALAACAPGFDALANPDLFLGQQLVRLGVDHRLLRHLLFLLHQIAAEIARV